MKSLKISMGKLEAVNRKRRDKTMTKGKWINTDLQNTHRKPKIDHHKPVLKPYLITSLLLS